MKNILTLTLALFMTTAACGEGPAPAPVTVLENGEACDAEDESFVCEGELCLEEFADGTDVDEGLCTDTCEWNEDFSDSCEEGYMCLNYRPTNEFFCFEDCSTDSDCRTEDGWSCLCLDFLCAEGACIPDLTDEGKDGTSAILEDDHRRSLYSTAQDVPLRG